MLRLEIPGRELWDETNLEFITLKPITLTMEHSLVAISKWEAKWHKPFLDDNEKTPEEVMDYVKCMTITQNVPPEVYAYMPRDVWEKITEYMNDSRSATWFSDEKQPSKSSGEKVTSELIYYWMTALSIPFECEKWNINRLLNLIKISNIKNQPEKKMSKKDIYARNRALNEANRAKFRSKG